MHAATVLFIALVWHVESSPTPLGTSDTETISVSGADEANAGTESFAQTCPAVLPLLGDQVQHARRGILRRDRTTTRFGTVIESVSQQAGTPPNNANAVNLRYTKGYPTPKNFVQVSLFEEDDMLQRVIPHWEKFNRDREDLTIQETRLSIDDFTNKDNPKVVDFLLTWAHNLWREHLTAIRVRNVAVNDINYQANCGKTMNGGWQFVISAFNSVPGFSYAVKRTELQLSPPSDAYASIAWNGKAIGVAACKLVGHVAIFLEWQLRFEDQNNGGPSSLTPQDAYYIQIVLYVLKDLLVKAKGIIAAAPSSMAPVTGDELKIAMALIGSGSSLSLAPGSGPLPQALLKFDTFTDMLGHTQMCRSLPAGSTSTS